jgi:cobalamin biosynthesis protein CobD/CbiB
MEGLSILLLALLIDILFGEPPRVIHPVVWMGKAISFWQRFAPTSRPSPDKERGGRGSSFSPSPSSGEGRVRQLVYGAVMVLVTICAFASLA